MKKTFLLLLLIAFCGGFIYEYKQWTQGFRPGKCLIDWPLVPEWETAAADSEILSILNQPFSYFAKGNQCFAFLSRDGKYVLKLFRADKYRLPFGDQKLRKWIGARTKKDLPPKARILKNLTSCHLALHIAGKQTGVIFVHLNPKRGNLPILKVKDALARTHFIDPARYRFALQKKAELMRAIPEEKEAFYALLDELKELGLINLDPKIGSNFGKLDGGIVQIDIGNFAHCPEKAEENRLIFQRKFESCSAY